MCQLTPSFLDESAQKESGTVSQLFEASDVSSFIEGPSELNEIADYQLLVAGPSFELLQLLLRILVSRVCKGFASSFPVFSTGGQDLTLKMSEYSSS